MNDTIKAIVGLLESGKPELQVAAAQVLGELRTKEPAVVRALAGAVNRSPILGRFCAEALAKIGSHEAIEAVAHILLEHEGLADVTSHLLAELGTAAHGVLAAAYPAASTEQRLRILGILARSPGKEAILVLTHALLAPETCAVAGELLRGGADRLAQPQQKAVREILAKQLGKDLDPSLPEVSLAEIVKVLAVVDAAGSRALLLRFAAPGAPDLVRVAALRALRGAKLTAPQVRAFMEALEDPAQKAAHDAMRDLLADLPELPDGLVPVLKRLLAARQPEQRLFALRMLRTVGGAEMAKVALKYLVHDDPRFVAAAAAALAHNRQAVEPLIRLLQTTREPALAQSVQQVLVQLGEHLPPKTLRTLVDKAVKLLPSNARTGDAMLDLAIAVGGGKLAPAIVERAIRLRRSRRYGDSLHVLARLASSASADDECHYQIALTRLQFEMSQPTAESAAPGNPTMGFFTVLVRKGFPLLERLKKESTLTPEALLRIARHFADSVGEERRFGTEMLRHLATRTKGRAGDEARVVLRAVGG